MTESPIAEARPWPLHRLLILAWLAVVVIAVAVHWHDILALQVQDPDDYMRLQQVRDWVGGQSWFDVSQHRFNPPLGGDMHWTRLIDPPIAAFLLLTPLIGATGATTLAMTLVPLLLLGACMAVAGYSARILIGRDGAILSALLIAISPSLMYQFSPLRIDHHGWQILMSGVVMLALLQRDQRLSGIVTGVAAAFWAQISAEALPYLGLIGAILALRYIVRREEAARFGWFLLVVAGASCLFFAADRPIGQWAAAHCDAISYPFLLPMVLASVVVGLGFRLPFAASAIGRGASLAVAGACTGGLFLLIAKPCLAGPFANLEPMVYRIWYLSVLEGLPVWQQQPMAIVAALWLPLVGALGTGLAWRLASDPVQKRHWATAAMLLAGAIVLALQVYRAQCVAQLYAMPGTVWLLLALLRRVRSIPKASLRLPLTALVIALPSPVPAMLGAHQLDSGNEPLLRTDSARDFACATPEGLRGLAKLPPARLLTPMELGPAVLVSTSHSVLASGYHRNHVVMAELMSAFLGSDANARDVMKRHGLTIVAYCRSFPENGQYLHRGPDGFFAHLEHGRAPAWLQPVRVEGSPSLRVWRVTLAG